MSARLQISDSHPRKSRLPRAPESKHCSGFSEWCAREDVSRTGRANLVSSLRRRKEANSCYATAARLTSPRAAKAAPSAAGSVGPARGVLVAHQMQTDTSARGASGRERARRLLSAFVLRACWVFFLFFFLPDPETLITTTHSAVCVCARVCPAARLTHARRDYAPFLRGCPVKAAWGRSQY